MTETYAYLIKLGVEKGYCVIPEFPIPTGILKNNKIDLVYARKKNDVPSDPENLNLDAWEIHYAIEIDGVDVMGYLWNSTFIKHAANYRYLAKNQGNGDIFKMGINVLYYHAYHRSHDGAWKNRFRNKCEDLWKKNKKAYEIISRKENFNMRIFLGYPQTLKPAWDDSILNLEIKDFSKIPCL